LTRIHLDHNATTPLRAEVRERWLEVLDELAGNPSSLHTGGRHARHLLDEARERTAHALGVGEDEVIFTSGGTEANNLAVLGAVRARGPGAALVTSAVEHSSVLGPAAQLEREGHAWSRAEVGSDGCVDAERVVELAAGRGCALISVMAANNEVGAVMPVARIGELLAARPPAGRPLLHCDAVQALGRLELPLQASGADLTTFSAHKVGGPVGVGVLVRRGAAALQPLAWGGEQEGGLRPGTEDVAGIVAASHAFELAVRERDGFHERVGSLARALWEDLCRALPEARLLGPPIDSERRLPGTLNVLLPGVDGKVLVTRLDLDGLEVSAGSACASGSLEPSHVLLAMGHDETQARAGLRLSLGRTTTLADARQAVDILRKAL
jgi:cysteine desulfurase